MFIVDKEDLPSPTREPASVRLVFVSKSYVPFIVFDISKFVRRYSITYMVSSTSSTVFCSRERTDSVTGHLRWSLE